MNAMREVHVDKVVVNIGVGEAGERLVKGISVSVRECPSAARSHSAARGPRTS